LEEWRERGTGVARRFENRQRPRGPRTLSFSNFNKRTINQPPRSSILSERIVYDQLFALDFLTSVASSQRLLNTGQTRK
jgi:hypothetical protein